MKTWRVITYNIHKGVHPFRNLSVIERVALSLKASKADFLLLQEVVGEHLSERKMRSQLEHLSDERWPHHAYGKNAIFPTRNHGNAVLSAVPIRRFHNKDLSIYALERRGLLHCELMAPLPGMHLCSVHLDLFDFKPELVKRHGQPSDFGEKVEAFQNGLGPWMQPIHDNLDVIVSTPREQRKDARGQAARYKSSDYLIESAVAIIATYQGDIVSVEIPASVELVISETEPGVQGDRVSGATKPATLETGKVIKVPLFVNTGDKVKVDTRSGEYITRV